MEYKHGARAGGACPRDAVANAADRTAGRREGLFPGAPVAQCMGESSG